MQHRDSPTRVVHVITGLDTGGAEMMLFKLLRSFDPKRIAATVISLLPPGEVGCAIEGLGIRVQSLGMSRGLLDSVALLRLIRLLRKLDADIVQTWLYHADLLAALSKPWIGPKALIWNLRQSDLSPLTSKLSTRATARACAALSWVSPRGIVCCSRRTREIHVALGYRADIMVTIPNGFDLSEFQPDTAARAELRAELRVADGVPLIGLVGRFDPQKDVTNFLRAGRMVQDVCRGAHLVICGRGMEDRNPKLRQLVAEAGVTQNLHLLGPRTDVARIMNGLDLLISSSAYGEGFPNVVGEAMASGTPCVVTDVGDSGDIVGETGLCVPPRQPQQLANAVRAMLLEGAGRLAERGAQARSRVAHNYALGAIAARYQAYYEQLLPGA